MSCNDILASHKLKTGSIDKAENMLKVALHPIYTSKEIKISVEKKTMKTV